MPANASTVWQRCIEGVIATTAYAVSAICFGTLLHLVAALRSD
jgi:hypothetical protein